MKNRPPFSLCRPWLGWFDWCRLGHPVLLVLASVLGALPLLHFLVPISSTIIFFCVLPLPLFRYTHPSFATIVTLSHLPLLPLSPRRCASLPLRLGVLALTPVLSIVLLHIPCVAPASRPPLVLSTIPPLSLSCLALVIAPLVPPFRHLVFLAKPPLSPMSCRSSSQSARRAASLSSRSVC